MIGQKDIELVLEIAKRNLVDMDKIDELAKLAGVMPFETMREDIGIQIAALSRIEAETESSSCESCNHHHDCGLIPCPGDGATVKENLTVQDVRELVYKIRRMRNERREYCQWLDDGVPEITTDEAVKLIEAHDAAIRADERRKVLEEVKNNG